MQDRRQFLVGGMGTGLVMMAPPAFSASAVSDLILDYSNQARRSNRRRTFRHVSALDKAARNYAVLMARTNQFSHTVGGTNLKGRLRKVGKGNGYMAENIAYRSPRRSADELARLFVENWLSSPGHRRNLLHPKLTQIGVGIAQNDRRLYAVQVFWGGA